MCTHRHIINHLLHLVWLVFYLPVVHFSKILISEAASVEWTDSWSTRQSSHTRSDQLRHTDGCLVLCCWWSLSSWSVLHTHLAGLHERSPVQNSPPQPAPRSHSPSDTRGALLNHPEQTTQTQRLSAFTTGRYQSAPREDLPNKTSDFQNRSLFCLCMQVCTWECTQKCKQLIQQYLAGVFAALLVSSADHVIQDVHLLVQVHLVHLLTWTLRDDWHLHLLQRSYSWQRDWRNTRTDRGWREKGQIKQVLFITYFR